MKSVALLVIAFAISHLQPISAQPDAVRTKQFNLEKGLALQGYDPVAYFTAKKAAKGSAQFTALYKGVTYRFASATNRDLFLKSSAMYEPAYGGWCAYAMGDSGEKVDVDPETFEVRDGRLYLFYNRLFTNTLPKWQKNEPTLQRKADQSWTRFIQ